MAIGIISAMSEEIDLLLAEMKDIKETISANRVYYKGKINHQEVIIAFSRWGKVAATITATDMIRTFNVSEIVFAGVAGAISTILNIGDIVIGNQLYQHDMNATPIFSEYEIPLIATTFFQTNTDNTTKLRQATNDFIDNYDFDFDIKQKFALHNPKLLLGTIASGDQFVSSEEKRQELISKTPDLLCVEMEGAAVAQVCHEFEIPYTIVRIISDKANHDAEVDFESFVSEVASIYSLNILKRYLNA